MLLVKRSVIILLGLFIAASMNSSLAAEASLSLPQQNFILNCQGCHLPDGSGSPGVVPRMTDFVGHFLQVDGGREFIVQVPGSANAPISDQELAELMNWLLMNFSKEQLPKDFVPYTSEEVGGLRRDPLIDINGTRADLIVRIKEKVGISEDGLNDG
jgi:hypothetical protein